MYKKILVVADGDDPYQPALRRALRCADDDATIEIFEAVYEPALEGYLGNREIYRPLRERLLHDRVARAASLARAVEGWGVRSTAHAVWDQPRHAAIAHEAARRNADLVVTVPLEGHGRALAHGDWQLVMSCPVPVLLVKNAGEAAYREIVAAVDPFHAHAKPAELDKSILRHAQRMRAAAGARLTALHCHPPEGYLGAHLGQPVLEAPSAGIREQAVRTLLEQTGVEGARVAVVEGFAHEVLCALPERGEADLIVMGALARGRLMELVIGHTAERVLHRAAADLLIVKQPATP